MYMPSPADMLATCWEVHCPKSSVMARSCGWDRAWAKSGSKSIAVLAKGAESLGIYSEGEARMRTTGSGAVFAVLVAAILAGGLGCQNAKDTQNLQQGYGALDLKDYQRAIAAADEYLKKHPTGNGAAEAAYLRGRAFEQRTKGSDAEAQANLREAKASYEQALSLMPSKQTEAFIRASLGNVSYWMNDFGAAEINWTAAYEKLEPVDLKAGGLYRTGLSQQRLGKWETADDTFAQVEK